MERGPWVHVPAPGQCVGGRYDLVRLVGRGAAGLVFEARDRRLDSLVAVKILFGKYYQNSCQRDAEQEANEKTATAYQVTEWKLLASLRHQNVVRALDQGVELGNPYVVLEFVDGQTIRERLDESGKFPIHLAIKIGEQVALALAAIHEAKIVHRDIKSSNIMLVKHDERVEVRILDFGVARRLEQTDPDVTERGGPLGTIPYMAPEVARGESTGCSKSDLYSLGVVLYEILAGRRPHDGPSQNAILFQILKDAPIEDLRRIRSDVPSDLWFLIRWMLNGKPGGRPSNALLVADRLRGIQNGAHSALEHTDKKSRIMTRWILFAFFGGLLFAAGYNLKDWQNEKLTAIFHVEDEVLNREKVSLETFDIEANSEEGLFSRITQDTALENLDEKTSDELKSLEQESRVTREVSATETVHVKIETSSKDAQREGRSVSRVVSTEHGFHQDNPYR